MKILVVDDDADFRGLLAQSAPPSMRVVPCGSSYEAVATLGRGGLEGFDLALVDLYMEPYLGSSPELEGLALVRWMRERGHHVPTVFASSYEPPHGAIEGEPMALGFLRKPVDLAKLFGLLEAYRRLFGRPEASPRSRESK